MKKFFLSQFIFLAALTVTAQGNKSTMKTAAEDICSCLSKVKVDSSNLKQYKEAAMNCFTTGAMEHIVQLAEERHLDVTDQKAMRGLGVEIGKELLKQKCPSYITFAKISAQEDENAVDEDAAKEFSTSGKLLKVDKKDFIYITIKDQSNREYNFIWLEYFKGSESFFGDKLNTLVGKDLTISWTEKEVFLPKANNYFKLKEINGIAVSK
jgi:hypothetical protein